MSRAFVRFARRGRRSSAHASRLAAAALPLVLVLFSTVVSAGTSYAASATLADVDPPAGSGSFTPAPPTSALPTPAPSSTYPAGSGGRVYADNCSGCHGPEGAGLVGPPLTAAGFATLVAPMVEQGGIAMPPFAGVLSDEDVRAAAGFVAQELADPSARDAEVQPGGDLYRLYCAGCHSATGRGGALTRGRNAPNIAQFPAAQALAAMILGRGNMPAFAGNTLDVRQQAAVALYVDVLVEPPSPGGDGLGYFGPVPEGAVSAIALLILIGFSVWLAWPSRRALP